MSDDIKFVALIMLPFIIMSLSVMTYIISSAKRPSERERIVYKSLETLVDLVQEHEKNLVTAKDASKQIQDIMGVSLCEEKEKALLAVLSSLTQKEQKKEVKKKPEMYGSVQTSGLARDYVNRISFF